MIFSISTTQLVWWYLTAKITKRLAIIFGILLMGILLLTPTVASSFAGLGGYISEKLLGNGTDAMPLLGDSADGPMVIASGPIISTLSVNDSASAGGVTTATLRGTLTTFNGMPQADVWWIWGYTPTTMNNTTATTTVTTIGEKTIVLSEADAGKTVYYQFRASTDGTSTGTTMSFVAGGAHGASYRLMNSVLLIIIVTMLFVFIVATSGNPLAALVGAIIGLIAFEIARALVSTL